MRFLLQSAATGGCLILPEPGQGTTGLDIWRVGSRSPGANTLAAATEVQLSMFEEKPSCGDRSCVSHQPVSEKTKNGLSRGSAISLRL